MIKISKNSGVRTNDLASVSGALTVGGSLVVTNIGTNTFIAGDSFKLFKAASWSGGFTNFSLPPLASGLIWKTNTLATNGTIAVSNIIYVLTYTAGTNGTTSGTSPQTVTYGASGMAVGAVPNTGYHFVNWSDGGTANPRTDANVTNNLAVTASFAANPVVPVIASGTVAFAGGGFTLGGTGGAGQTYILLMASNLVSPVWMPMATNMADTNGVFNFTDPGATNNLQQFYRVSSP